ncbi:acyltransferase [Acidaminobacter sp. JC074]|uniref:acyltransferase family protein n=1 Tax=Acidaminobacter sp. JC074 TaxID=2530199 RepID=UPI001F0F8C27|nr:acyltransferase [Acidaminobacter sp. JC074]MCH4891134.1 acyltransferase [Acidaminobacter sp. JC074]
MKNRSIDYMKAFVIVLVVIQHAVLAYNVGFVFDDSYLVGGVLPVSNLTNPVHDTAQWSGFNLFVGMNDQFFMSLMFLISGFFVYKSLKKYGTKSFVGRRAKRLMLPVLLGIPTVIVLAYYPAALQSGFVNGTSPIPITEFFRGVASVGFMSGPLWFLTMLFNFNLIVALVYRFYSKRKKRPSWLDKITLKSPFTLYCILIMLSLLLSASLNLVVHPIFWFPLGFASFQFTRLLHYFVYFIIGILIGKNDKLDEIFSEKSRISQLWYIFLLIGILSYIITDTMPNGYILKHTLCSAPISFAVIGFFAKYVHKPNKVIDNFSGNAFNIYIFHIAFSSWIQYFLLYTNMPAVLKGIVAASLTLILSWIFSDVFSKLKLKVLR